jgi:hypothetical protein
MAKTNNLKKMEQNYTCKFCAKSFHKESTLLTHMCVKKQRHMDLSSAGSRLGFRAFQRFFEINTHSKRTKTTTEFIESPYYIGFVKFGNYVAMLKPVYLEQFIDFVIRNGVELRDWTDEHTYKVYIIDLIKKEPPVSATERTIIHIMEWCDENKIEFGEFFKIVTANEGAYLISTGKISPWVLYLCGGGGELMDKFSADHSKMISDIIDPGYWMNRFKRDSNDVDFIRDLLEQSGL